ncbi:MAG: hypothetical protein J0M34_02765 [Alphaproteobacteria bacterium]|nr:hypothetical protein [Alphaproteobacteria bacterium]
MSNDNNPIYELARNAVKLTPIAETARMMGNLVGHVNGRSIDITGAANSFVEIYAQAEQRANQVKAASVATLEALEAAPTVIRDTLSAVTKIGR